MANYISSKETWYDEDKCLYYKYIGRDDSKKTLMYTAWGFTKEVVDLKSKFLVDVLNRLSANPELFYHEIKNQ